MTDHKNKDFSFDYWLKLYEKEPELAEALRSKVIAAYIQSVPSNKIPMLNNLQKQIDILRDSGTDPLSNTENISKLMLEKYSELDDLSTEYVKRAQKQAH